MKGAHAWTQSVFLVLTVPVCRLASLTRHEPIAR